MIIETVIESYLFTCARCATQWTASYEVRQATDAAGAIQSSYRNRGLPCAAPASGNDTCPACGSTRVRVDPRYDETPVVALGLPADPPIAVPQQRAALASPVPRRHGAPGTWHRFRFLAVISLDARGQADRQYPSGVPGLLVRAPCCRRPTLRQYFPALIFTDDMRPLRPGDKGVSVTICVPDDDASAFFQCGQHFTLWDGADIGHGTVAYRLFFGWPELS